MSAIVHIGQELCKFLCHNICVLIQEMYELGIEPEFWQEKQEAGVA
jgi:myo-inositol catabolism protein IolC